MMPCILVNTPATRATNAHTRIIQFNNSISSQKGACRHEKKKKKKDMPMKSKIIVEREVAKKERTRNKLIKSPETKVRKRSGARERQEG